MARLLLEVGRYRSRGYDGATKYRRWTWRGDAFDWGASHQRLRQGYNRLDVGDYMAPLNRYLLRQVGRSWLLVQKDLLEGLDARRLRDRHLHQHVEGMVGYSRASHGCLPCKDRPFVVDADTGLLELR